MDPIQSVGEIAPLTTRAAAQVGHQRRDGILKDRPHEPQLGLRVVAAPVGGKILRLGQRVGLKIFS